MFGKTPTSPRNLMIGAMTVGVAALILFSLRAALYHTVSLDLRVAEAFGNFALLILSVACAITAVGQGAVGIIAYFDEKHHLSKN